MNNKLLFGALVAAAVVASPSAAVTVVGSAAVAIVGVSANTPSIGVGTTFTNTLFSVVGSGVGDFTSTVGQFVVISPLTASFGAPFTFTSSFGNFAGTVQSAGQQGPSTNRTVEAYVLGTFTPAGSLASFTSGPASATFSFTQTGIGAAVSGSFSFASPPAGIPEPATWGMLITGFGLVGFAARRRKAGVVVA